MANANVAVQTSYSERMKPGVAGQVANGRDFDSITRTAEGDDGIGFGLAVSVGSDDGLAVLGGALTGFLGVSLRDPSLDPSVSPGDKYAEDSNMGILTEGSIWVQVGEEVTAADGVYYNTTTGVFYGAAGAGRAGPVLGARYEKTSHASGIGILNLSGYNQAAA